MKVKKKELKRVNILIEPSKWKLFCEISRKNNSDASKETRKLIDMYLEYWVSELEKEKDGNNEI